MVGSKNPWKDIDYTKTYESAPTFAELVKMDEKGLYIFFIPHFPG